MRQATRRKGLGPGSAKGDILIPAAELSWRAMVIVTSGYNSTVDISTTCGGRLRDFTPT